MTRMFRQFRPAQAISLSFSLIIFLGTVLLSLPISKSDGKFGIGLDQLFTTVSALCVTGLSVVDTETYWQPFGHFVILALIKVGGFGIMAFTGLLALIVVNRLSMRTTAYSSEEHRALKSGDIRKLLIRIALVGFIIETLGTTILTIQLFFRYGYTLPDAFWHSLFHSVSAFNNAGFSLYSDNLVRFNGDPLIMLTLCVQIILGSLGFPVLLEIGRHITQNLKARPSGVNRIVFPRWSLTARIVIVGSAILLAGGFLYFAALEWNNPNTIGPMPTWQKLLNAFVLSVMPRTAGFNSVDIGALTHESWLGMDLSLIHI
jgi:trk system potassium uptake protein TrkH